MYFSTEFVDFFKGLAANNSKEYFDDNRSTYHKYVKDPWYNFIEQTVERLSKTEPEIAHLQTKDAVFRINRDIRFSKDKTPYKLHLSAILSPEGRKNMRLPGMYLQLGIGESWMGGGMYAPDKNDIQAIRTALFNHPKKFNEIVIEKSFVKHFGEVKGEKNKIIPKEFKAAAATNPYLFNKQWYYMKEFEDGEKLILSSDLLDQVEDHFISGKPFNDFFKGIL